MTQQSGGAGIPLTQTVSGVLSGSILSPAFATNGTDALLAVHAAHLAADVPMTVANQYFDGPTIALTAGSWLVWANITISTPTAASVPTLRLWDGTTSYVSTGASNPGAGSEVSLAVGYPIVLVAPATIRASVATLSTTAIIVAATLTNAVGNNASSIFAMRYA